MHYIIWSLNCVVRHYFFKNIVQLFIKFTHSFVAIELLTFCKKYKKTILLLKRALGIPYVNRIDFLIFVYINVSQKNWFLYMNENDDDCHHWKTTRTFIYTKAKNRETFIYTKIQKLCKKRENLQYCLYEVTDHKVGIYCNVIGPLAALRHMHFRAKRF